MALPVYTMNCFKLPKGICDEINSILANVWWNKKPGKRAMHWVSWKRMGLPKKEGGLGLRDLENFNLALLGKHAWRILQAPTSLLTRLLKGRYFPNSNIFITGPGNKSSFIWKSLLEGRDLLKKGMRTLISNGQSTSIWGDPWLPTNPPRPPRRIEGVESDLRQVSELMSDRSSQWNMDLMGDIIVAEDLEIITKIRLSPVKPPDLLGWHYNIKYMLTLMNLVVGKLSSENYLIY